MTKTFKVAVFVPKYVAPCEASSLSPFPLRNNDNINNKKAKIHFCVVVVVVVVFSKDFKKEKKNPSVPLR